MKQQKKICYTACLLGKYIECVGSIPCLCASALCTEGANFDF